MLFIPSVTWRRQRSSLRFQKMSRGEIWTCAERWTHRIKEAQERNPPSPPSFASARPQFISWEKLVRIADQIGCRRRKQILAPSLSLTSSRLAWICFWRKLVVWSPIWWSPCDLRYWILNFESDSQWCRVKIYLLLNPCQSGVGCCWSANPMIGWYFE